MGTVANILFCCISNLSLGSLKEMESFYQLQNVSEMKGGISEVGFNYLISCFLFERESKGPEISQKEGLGSGLPSANKKNPYRKLTWNLMKMAKRNLLINIGNLVHSEQCSSFSEGLHSVV